VLKSKNVTQYPQMCAEATASFSVLSDTINVVQQVLLQQSKKKSPSNSNEELSELVRNLQAHEREKLNLTAALHLERIREQQQQPQIEAGGENLEDGNGGGSGGGGDVRIAQLLREGVKSLEQKIANCVEAINDDIEEIRCAMMDAQDDA